MAESGRSAHGDYERRSSSPRTASKRKYEEPVEPPPRQQQQQQHRPPPPPPAPESQRPSYKSVPPPLSDFELAKQRAEQIAARLVGDEFKRARTIADDNDGVGNVERGGGHYAHQDDRQSADFYAQHQTKRVDVPNTKVGLVIGKGGETIRTLQQQSGAKIQVTRDAEADPGAMTRQVELTGTPEQISRAEQLIREVVGDQGIVGGSVMGVAAGGVGEPIHVRVPNNKVGLIIGKGGETIRNLQQSSGARIQVQHDRETEPGATERIVTLVGTKQQTDIATDMIKDVIGEGRSRGGGYQQGYQRPSQAWSGQSQSGYGYQQQGYGSQQYGGYGGWDQNQQQGSYEYYQNSEGAPQAEGDPNYNYGQQGYYYDQQAYEQQYQQGYDQSGAYNQPSGYNQEEYPAGYGYEYDQTYSYDQSGQYAQNEGGAAVANAAPAAAAATTPATEAYSQQPPPASSSAAQTAHT